MSLVLSFNSEAIIVKTMNDCLLENFQDSVQKQADTAGYGSISEYVRELIRSDQARHAQ